MALIVATWIWGSKYCDQDVRKLYHGLTRHMGEPFQFEVFGDEQAELKTHLIKDPHLTAVRGCFVRLRLFDPETQKALGAHVGTRIVCIDLDVVVTGSLLPLFQRPDPFVIFGGANAANPCPYNGSVWMLRAGYRPDVWESFSLEAAQTIPKYEFPDDQGWFWTKMPNESTWQVGPESGIYAFQKPGWPKGSDDLPKGARIVAFPGWRDPAKFKHLPWVKEHWR